MSTLRFGYGLASGPSKSKYELQIKDSNLNSLNIQNYYPFQLLILFSIHLPLSNNIIFDQKHNIETIFRV